MLTATPALADRSRLYLVITIHLLLIGLVSAVEPASVPAKPSNKEKLPASDAAAWDRLLINEASAHSEIMPNLTYLSDMIGPRLTGSEALKRANEWAVDKMREYGLQNVHLEPWTIPLGWQRGTATARLVEPHNGHAITLAAAGWTPGTNGPVTAEVAVVTAKDSKALLAYKGKLKGKIVLRGEPEKVRPVTETAFDWDNPTRRGARPGSTGPNLSSLEQMQKMIAFRREFADFIRDQGAVAILTDAGKPQGLLNMGGGWRGNDRASAAEPTPALFVAHEDYAFLYRLASRPAPAHTRLELAVQNTFIPGPIIVYNTVGEIPGTEKPNESVVLGGHLDSWDLGQGTTDDGTGTVVVLEAARVLVKSGARPHRTIRFILFTGEEQGIHGSSAYVQQHKSDMPHISMCLVHDLGTGRVKGIGLMGHAAIKPILEQELASLKPLGVTDLSLRRMAGSDHASFDGAGVPGFYCQQEPAEYRFTHHSQSDTLDKAHEPDLIQGVQVMAVAALRVANLPDLLPRDKSERK
jgi:carboxypeptidase Q